MLNPALSVEAVGFRPWDEHWLGVLVTPWFMNLWLMPRVASRMAADRRGREPALRLPGRRVRVHRRLASRRSATTRPARCSRRCSTSPTRPARTTPPRPPSRRCSTRPARVARLARPASLPTHAAAAAPAASAAEQARLPVRPAPRRATVGLEGELRVGLRVDGGARRLRCASPRPGPTWRARCCRAARAPRSCAVVPRLFSICGVRRPRPANWPAPPPPASAVDAGHAGALPRQRCRPRRCARPPGAPCSNGRKAIGELPGDGRHRGRARRARHPAAQRRRRAATPSRWPPSAARADDWLALQTAARAATAGSMPGHTAAARFVRHARDDDAAAGTQSARRHGRGAAARHAGARGLRSPSWRQAGDADPGFARQPTWRGAPAETGALARQQSDPLIARADAASATRACRRASWRGCANWRCCWPAAAAPRSVRRPCRTAAASPGSRTRADC